MLFRWNTIGTVFNDKSITTFPELNHFVNVKTLMFKRGGSINELGVRNITTAGMQCLSDTHITKPLVFDNLAACQAHAFNSMTTVSAMIIRSNVVPTVGGTPLFGDNFKIDAIYVPDDLVDAYKAATGWSTKASIIFPLSDCPYDYN